MKPTVKSLKKKLDKLWRTTGKENAVCAICSSGWGKTYNYTQLHPHHMISRKKSLTRWDLANRLWVCPSHHTLSDQCVEYNQEGWFWGARDDWLSTYMPARKLWLQRMRIKGNKPIQWKVEMLEAIIKKYKKLLK